MIRKIGVPCDNMDSVPTDCALQGTWLTFMEGTFFVRLMTACNKRVQWVLEMMPVNIVNICQQVFYYDLHRI